MLHHPRSHLWRSTPVRFAAGLLVLGLSFTDAIADLTLVRDGHPTALIVMADRPSPSAERAAGELQSILLKMSGATIPIVRESADFDAATTALLVGRSRFVRENDIPSGDDPFHTREGFVLRTRKNQVVLAGNETPPYRGTEYAVSALLEQLGCRWFFPGTFGEVIPVQPTVTLPDLDLRETPSFPVRNIWMSGWADGTSSFDTWLIRNKGSDRSAFAFPGDGSIHLLAPPSRYADSDPDIYALRPNGERMGAATPLHEVMLCTSSKKAVAIAASNLVAYFTAHPEADSFGFSAPDGSPRCYCPTCLAANHGFRLENGVDECIADAYFNFVNNIAAAVRPKCPGKLIVVLAYANRVRPPEGLDQPWSSNILVQIAQLRTSALRPLGATQDFFALRRGWTIEAWSRLSPRFLVYDYDPHADLSRMPYWQGSTLAQDLQFYRARGGLGFTTEGQPTFLRTGLNYYYRTRLMWKVETDLNALRRDFCDRFFGPAAPPMEAFIRTVESALETTPDSMTWTPLYADWTAIFSPETESSLAQHIQTAQAAVKGRPPFQERVAAFAGLVDYLTAYQSAFRALRAGRTTDGLQAIARFTNRIDRFMAIQKDLMPPDPGWVLADQQGLRSLQNRFREIQDRSDGPLGLLVGRAPLSVSFKTDPHGDGLFAQWQRTGVADGLTWKPLDLNRDWSLNGYRDEQGYPFDGWGWYRFAIPASVPPKGRRIFLFFPELYAETFWVWINDQLVFSPPDAALNTPNNPTGRVWAINRRGGWTVSVEVTRSFQPGRPNHIAFLTRGTLDRAQHRGIVGAPFLWAARE